MHGIPCLKKTLTLLHLLYEDKCYLIFTISKCKILPIMSILKLLILLENNLWLIELDIIGNIFHFVYSFLIGIIDHRRMPTY